MIMVLRRTHTDPRFYNFRILKLFDQMQSRNVLFIRKILNNKVVESVCETSINVSPSNKFLGHQ